MIVSRGTFDEIIAKFKEPGHYSLDTETTGLHWYKSDRLFAVILADASHAYSFNFRETPDHLGKCIPPKYMLPREWMKAFDEIFRNNKSLWYMHNAKFDLGMLSKEGLTVPAGSVHCTEAIARLLNPTHMSYSLEECVRRMGFDREYSGKQPAKSDAVKEYIMQNDLFEDVQIVGKEKTFRKMYYDRVPFDIMVQYQENDAYITRELGEYQQRKIQKFTKFNERLPSLVATERLLTKVLFKAQKTGINVNNSYINEALEYEMQELEKLKRHFKNHTFCEFSDSNNLFEEIFVKEGIDIEYTQTGRPSFTEVILSEMDHPVADLILEIRSKSKNISTYYSSYKWLQNEGRIHADSKQGGTITGRMSYRDPNLQNVPKETDQTQKYTARKCFIPSTDHILFMPDYDQMEYRMMLDMAEETNVIKRILEDGLDVHEATAQLMGVDRKKAKTINFMLLYGGGVDKLATQLEITTHEATELRKLYFDRLPNVKRWIYRVRNKAINDKKVVNWAGRTIQLDKQFVYKAPNYLIQGGCADVVKIAMVECAELLRKRKSKFLLQVHDELIFDIHKDELDVMPEIVELMANVFPHKLLPLTAAPSYSYHSWAEKVEGFPEEARNQVQRESNQDFGQTTEHLVSEN